MLKSAKSYQDLYSSFRWDIPKHYNIGIDICDKHAHDKSRLALIHEKRDGTSDTYTFHLLKRLSNRFANVALRDCRSRVRRLSSLRNSSMIL